MNKGADALAVQAALAYAPPERLVIGTKTRRKQALAIQATAIAILEVRALVKPLHGSCSDEHNDLLRSPVQTLTCFKNSWKLKTVKPLIAERKFWQLAQSMMIRPKTGTTPLASDLA